MYCSASFSAAVMAHAGSIDMSILTRAGGLPVKWMVPLMLPAFATGAGAAWGDSAAGVGAFDLQPERVRAAARKIAVVVLSFVMACLMMRLRIVRGLR